MMSAKKATLGILKLRIIWNNGYYIIISAHDVTNKILLRNSNYSVDVVMWQKSSISMTEVINSIL